MLKLAAKPKLAVAATLNRPSQGFNLSNNYNGIVTLQASDITGNPLLGAL